MVFSERELTFTFAIKMSLSVRLSVVCNVGARAHPNQTIGIFGNVLRCLVRWTSVDFEVKFYGDRPVGGVKPKRGSQI